MGRSEINIWQYIKHYLHKHNELCLMGVGRFASQTYEFTVDPVAKKIIPAFRKVYFQQGEFETNVEFIQFLVHTLNLDENEIVDKLAAFSNQLTESLQSSPKLEIPSFGTFKFNVMGELVFDSANGEIFDDHSFGLKPIHFAANLLRTKRIIVDKQEEEQEEEELTLMRESALKELKVLLDNARISENQSPKKKSKLFPIVATVLTLILLINLGFFLFKGPVGELKKEVSQMSILGKTAEILDSQASEIPAIVLKKEVLPETNLYKGLNNDANWDSIAAHVSSIFGIRYLIFDSTSYFLQEQEQKVDSKIEEVEINTTYQDKIDTIQSKLADDSNYDLPNMVNVDALENNVDKGFYVIAGAFKSELNASKLKLNLEKLGSANAIVIKPKTHPYFLVAFEKSKTLNQALLILEEKQKEQESIWVYCAY